MIIRHQQYDVRRIVRETIGIQQKKNCQSNNQTANHTRTILVSGFPLRTAGTILQRILYQTNDQFNFISLDRKTWRKPQRMGAAVNDTQALPA